MFCLNLQGDKSIFPLYENVSKCGRSILIGRDFEVGWGIINFLDMGGCYCSCWDKFNRKMLFGNELRDMLFCMEGCESVRGGSHDDW